MDEDEEGQVYRQAMERMLEQMRARIREDRQVTLQVSAQQEEDQRKAIEDRRLKTEMRLRYQKELQQQIKSDHVRKETETSEKQKPGIAEEFHGYPNLPQTPRAIRRRREIEKQVEFSQSVTEQLAANQRLRREATEAEMKLVRGILDQDLRDREKALQDERSRKMTLRAKMQKAWLQADRTKRLIKELEQSELSATPKPDPPATSPTLPPLEESQKPAAVASVAPAIEEMKTEPTVKKLKKKEELVLQLTEQLSVTQIQSLAQLMAGATTKLPVIREYSANDIPLRSPGKKELFRVRNRQNTSVSCAHRHRSDCDKSLIQERLTRLHTKIRRGLRPPSSPLKVRTHSLNLCQRSPVRADFPRAVNRTYITENDCS